MIPSLGREHFWSKDQQRKTYIHTKFQNLIECYGNPRDDWIATGTLLTTEDFWFKCNLYLQLIPPINLWNKCIDLKLFSKCKEGPFSRSLRSNDDRCCILRLGPWKFAIVPESLAPKLEKVRQTSVWQTVPKFWFIWLWYLSYRSKSLRNNKIDKYL